MFNAVDESLFEKLCAVEVERLPDTISQEEDKHNFIKNKTFVFTGKLSTLTRNEAHNIIKNNGGLYSSTVSYKCDYLVTATDGSNHTKKVKDAKAKNVEILSEGEFLNKIKYI